MITAYPSPQAPRPRPTSYIGRFAPSPTGPLHFGSLIAAVGSYMQARVSHGRWLLRIEDLDQPRVVPGAAENIISTLTAFGFEWDGVIEYQSRHLNRYAAAIEQLHKRQRIYACSCSRMQIANNSALAPSDNDELRYPGTCRLRTHLPSGSASKRFVAMEGVVQFIDRIQGAQKQDVASTCGDFIVQRRDRIYAYHLAVVADDATQNVTEVVRGADLLSCTPRQILLQQALDLPMPNYCHLPVAIDAAGRKLSKSSQSRAIDPSYGNAILWQALNALRQSPPSELQTAPISEIWEWAEANWSLAPLAHQLNCAAPAP